MVLLIRKATVSNRKKIVKNKKNIKTEGKVIQEIPQKIQEEKSKKTEENLTSTAALFRRKLKNTPTHGQNRTLSQNTEKSAVAHAGARAHADLNNNLNNKLNIKFKLNNNKLNNNNNNNYPFLSEKNNKRFLSETLRVRGHAPACVHAQYKSTNKPLYNNQNNQKVLLKKPKEYLAKEQRTKLSNPLAGRYEEPKLPEPKTNPEVRRLFKIWNIFADKYNFTKVNINNPRTKIFKQHVKVAKAFLAGTLGKEFGEYILSTGLKYISEKLLEPRNTNDFGISLCNLEESFLTRNKKQTNIFCGKKLDFSKYFIGDRFSGAKSQYILFGLSAKSIMQYPEQIKIFEELWNKEIEPIDFHFGQKAFVDLFISDLSPEYERMKNRYKKTTNKFKDHFEFLFYITFGVLKKIKKSGEITMSPRALNGGWFRKELEKYRVETGHVR